MFLLLRLTIREYVAVRSAPCMPSSDGIDGVPCGEHESYFLLHLNSLPCQCSGVMIMPYARNKETAGRAADPSVPQRVERSRLPRQCQARVPERLIDGLWRHNTMLMSRGTD